MPRKTKDASRPVVPGPAVFGKAKRVAINVFLIFHLVAITCWCMPAPDALVSAIRERIAPYMLWSGLFQAWDMFAPQPKNANTWVEAIVLYADGNTGVWKFPRMEQLSLSERYIKERYRKYTDNLKEDPFAALWPDAARKIARLNNTGPSPVRMVLLVRHWASIIPGSEVASPENQNVFFSYQVRPEDLK